MPRLRLGSASLRRFALLDLVVLAGVACARAQSAEFGRGDDAGSASSSGTSGTDASTSADAPSFSSDGSTGGPPGPTCGCSADLHRVIDCSSGAVLQTCPADQACATGAAGGSCEPACKAVQDDQSSVGCDYFAVHPANVEALGCFAAFVANTWGTPVDISVDFDGAPLTNYASYMRVPSGSGPGLTYAPLGGSGNTLQPGQVAIVFLSAVKPLVYETGAPCPADVTPAFTGNTHTWAWGSGIGKAFHIATTRPVVAYEIFPYGGGAAAITAATLLLPTSAWDTNYVAADGYWNGLANEMPGVADPSQCPSPYTTDLSGTMFGPYVSVVAQNDGTSVTVSPTATIRGVPAYGVNPGLTGADQGMPSTWMLDRGQVLQLVQCDNTELNGSPIQTSQPVGVFGGHSCPFVGGAWACDTLMQQIPPVRAWGHRYVYARYRDRFEGVPESPPVRIFGAVDGTTLTYDPSPPAGAPTTLKARQWAEFTPSAPFSVSSQDDEHPIYLAAYMTGGAKFDPSCQPPSCTQSAEGRGDPEFVNVVPPQQYMSEYTFFTDPTYPETELVVVRQRNAAGGLDDVSLDCLAGPVDGWQSVGAAGAYEYARVDLVTGNFVPVGSCDNGVHQMHSKTPFGLTVWGWGSAATGGSFGGSSPDAGIWSQFVSYAYPAGMNVQRINKVVVPPAVQ